ITVDLFSFVLPPKSVDRSLFKMTLILGYTVFLFSMNDLLPITGDTIPLINVFLSLCLTMMVASLLETILITNLLCGSAHYRPVPRFVRVLVLQILGRLVLLSPKPRALEDRVIQNPAAGGRMTGLRCGFTGNIIHVDMSIDLLPQLFCYRNKRALSCGPLEEDKALQELRSLGRDLQDFHLQLKQQLDGNQGSEDWIQVGFIIDRLLFGLYILFILVSFITMTVIWLQSYNIS
uniref:Neurotransmitter-gated ion-channel transmembrane domain-containing protein n=1 Tax=Labrus bergylta TaxID=56723 RepID=A0A3Q3ERT9_9LABR